MDLQKIAKLARLQLLADEAAEFQPQIQAILAHVESLQSVVIPQEQRHAHLDERVSIFREDEPSSDNQVSSSLNLVECSPGQMNGYFEVPQVVSQ